MQVLLYIPEFYYSKSYYPSLSIMTLRIICMKLRLLMSLKPLQIAISADMKSRGIESFVAFLEMFYFPLV